MEDSQSSPQAVHLARLRWRCRRGMRELDELLQRYLEQRYPNAQQKERRAFESLLELQDPTLLSYLLGYQTPMDPELQHVITRVTEAGHSGT
jgi:antitoxin CptB